MRKLFRILIASLVVVLALSFSSCAIGLTCVSHIDKNSDGKCDNCGQKMEVIVSNVESIAVKTQPTKLYYAYNETIDVSGGEITVTYNDGTAAQDLSMSAEGVTILAPSTEAAGEAYVSVTYKGKSTRYKIEVGAAKYTVSFDLGYENATAIASQNIIVNEKATKPADPTRDGYDFAGWFTTSDGETVFDFDMVSITENTTVYAKWTQVFSVTYDVNYDDGEDLHRNTINGKADSTVVPASRTGYTFAGWYTDDDCETTFNFDSKLTSNTTIYAKWVSEATTMYTVTFNTNYGTTPAKTTAQVAEGLNAAVPATPVRTNISEKGHQVSNFAFGGWYTDAACTTAYDFNSAVNEDIELFAKWTGTYIFEAEHVSFIDPSTGLPMQGMGASGGSVGANMVDSPAPGQEGINASNGYYVTYLYAYGLSLSFVIESDRAVSDATLIFRISAENAPYALDPVLNDGETENGTMYSRYTISVNSEPIFYNTIEVTDTTGHSATGGKRPFSDFTLSTSVSLVEGRNILTFFTDNTHGMGGTMSGTAPVIDCIKIATSAELSWQPLTSNEFGQ